MLIEYAKGFGGRTDHLVLDEVQLESGRVPAWNRRWESESVFRFSVTASVAPG